MAQFVWPPITTANPSVSGTGGPAPSSATEVAGVDSGTGNLVAVKVGSDGSVYVNATSLPLPTGAATAAKQDTGNTLLASIDTKTPALGQAAMAASSPVVIASNQSAVPISAASLPLPTGAATETTLSALNTKVPAQGQAAMAASVPVVLASNQSSIPVAATLQAGSAIVGKVGIDQTTPGTTNGVQVVAALPAGSNVIGALTANQSVNNAQINGVTPLMGNGVTGTGSQRVTIASDNTPFTVNTQVIPQSGSTNAATSVASTALEASHVLKASAGRLFQLTGVNTKSSAQYIQVFNSTTVPADTTVPILLAYVPANSCFSFDFGAIGRYFSTGIAVSNSSTAATKTIGSSDCWFNAEIA